MGALLVKKPLRRPWHLFSLVCWGLYCLDIFLISGWLGWEPPKVGWGLYAAAISPAFAVGLAIFGMGCSLCQEPDEFLRMVQVQSWLIALGLTLFTCTAWGFLAQYAHVWSLPLSLVFPLWAFWMGLASIFVHIRYR